MVELLQSQASLSKNVLEMLNNKDKRLDSLCKTKLYVVFFNSPNIVSRVIRKFERIFLKKAEFSHVGLLFHTSILYDSTKICKPKDKFLVLESTMGGKLNDNVKNTCQKIEFGVQTRDLIELLDSYSSTKGNIAISSITVGMESWISKFNFCLAKYLGRGYEIIPTNLLSIHLPIPAMRTKNMFCSELVISILMELIVNLKYSKKKVSPNRLLELGILTAPVPLI